MSFEKGEEFEDFAESLFPATHYELLHRTPPHETYLQGNHLFSKPDFQFLDKKTNRCFYVEAKFRRGLKNNMLEWSHLLQLDLYRKFDYEAPVFILVGLGGYPSDPNQIFLMPLSEIEWPSLYPSVFLNYEIEADDRVRSRDLWG